MSDEETPQIPEDEPSDAAPEQADPAGDETPEKEGGSEMSEAAAAALAAAQRAIADAMRGDADEASEEDEAALGAAAQSVADSHSAAGRAIGAGGGPVEDPTPFRAQAFSPAPPSADPAEIQLLGDVNVDVRIELGRTRMLVEDVLRLSAGAVVELEKLAGDPVDVYVNGRHVARGEVLVLNENFCVRVNEVLEPLPVRPAAS
jgi:flagellar motor switch protein FliN/FliY